MKARLPSGWLALALGAFAAVGWPAPAAVPTGLAAGLDSLQAADLRRHMAQLSSDEFEGRAPGTRGEELTVNYLVRQFQSMGLKPGHPQGGYVQEVPLMGI